MAVNAVRWQLYVVETVEWPKGITLYSVRNSVSMRLNRRSSHESSNAVKMGSRELQHTRETKAMLIELLCTPHRLSVACSGGGCMRASGERDTNLSAISELDDSARYALMRDCEWRNESLVLEYTQSSQPQRTSCGIGSVAPRSSSNFRIS